MSITPVGCQRTLGTKTLGRFVPYSLEILEIRRGSRDTVIEKAPFKMTPFAFRHEDEEGSVPPGWEEEKGSRAMLRWCVALEADGPSHFYRPHGRPWHWTSNSKLRHRILTAAGVRVAHVPYYDWAILESLELSSVPRMHGEGHAVQNCLVIGAYSLFEQILDHEKAWGIMRNHALKAPDNA